MIRVRFVATLTTLWLSFAAAGCSHLPRSGGKAVPFSDPYRDGYVLALWKAGYSDAELDLIMKRIQQTGARHLEVVFLGCQPDIFDSDVGSCELRPFPYMLKVLDRAIAAGFDATILPIMEGKHFEWRGTFQPKDIDRWFKTYTAWIVKIAKEARARNLRELVVGTEFSALQKQTKHWREVIAEVRKVYRGPLIYTASWDALDVGFWDAVDAIGVSAYFPLSDEEDPSQEVLDLAWQKRKAELLELSSKHGRPIHVTEVGYFSATRAAAHPNRVPDAALKDEALQARCFEAFRRTWKDERKLVRASVWAANGPESDDIDITFDPVGRPAESTLRAFFDERARLR